MSYRGYFYIHVYTGIRQDTISYSFPDETFLLGENLLDFIYMDSAFSGEESRMTEELKSLHPYFRHISDEGLRSCIESSSPANEQTGTSNGRQNGYCTPADISSLQGFYRDLLTLYAQENISRKLLSHLADTSLYERSQIVYRNDEAQEDHFLSGFSDCLYLEFTQILRRQILVKVCKNCGRLFLPLKSNIDYCSRPYTANGKTCQDVGYSQTFARNVKNDDLLLAYTRAYKAHYARMTKPRKRTVNMTREEFEAWYKEAKDRLELARSGKIDPEAYKEWLRK